MTADKPVRIAIAALDFPIRVGLRTLLLEAGDFIITCETASLAELDFETRPDVVLTTENPLRQNIRWPTGQNSPALLLLTNDPDSARRLVEWEAGGWGVLSLDTSADEITAAILALSSGLWVGDPVLVQHLLSAKADIVPVEYPGDETLTNRELEVLQGLSQGLANKQIGFELGISEHTVKFHVSSIYTKLGASNRTEAVRIGVQRGLITL